MNHPISYVSQQTDPYKGPLKDYLPAVYVKPQPQYLANLRRGQQGPSVSDSSDDAAMEALNQDSLEAVTPYIIDLNGSQSFFPALLSYRQTSQIAAYEQAEKSVNPENQTRSKIDLYL
jgi:hypothetical protein